MPAAQHAAGFQSLKPCKAAMSDVRILSYILLLPATLFLGGFLISLRCWLDLDKPKVTHRYRVNRWRSVVESVGPVQ